MFTWIRRITVNESLNWQRRWKRRFRWRHHSIEEENRSEIPELGSDENSPEKLYGKKELEKLFKQGLNKLPEDARTILMLKELEGLSYEEIADQMKINKGTVSSRIFYAREKLRQILKDFSNGSE